MFGNDGYQNEKSWQDENMGQIMSTLQKIFTEFFTCCSCYKNVVFMFEKTMI